MAKTNKTMNLAFALMVGSAGAAYAGIPAVNSVQNVQQDETCNRYRQGCYWRNSHWCFCSHQGNKQRNCDRH